MSTDNAGQFVSVPVPTEHVMAVMEFIADLYRGSGRASVRQPELSTSPVSNHRHSWDEGELWAVEDLRRVASGEVTTTESLTAVLDFLAQAPDEWKNLDDIAGATGIERNKLRNLWTQVTRHLKKHYRGRWWPLDTGWGDEIPVDGSHIAYYRVTDAQATRWLEARGSA